MSAISILGVGVCRGLSAVRPDDGLGCWIEPLYVIPNV